MLLELKDVRTFFKTKRGTVKAVNGVSYEIVPVEIFMVYPVILVAVSIIAAFFTSIYTNTIKSSDASNIE